MTRTVAIAGKGGVGKTSLAALIIEGLSRKGLVLAIDADPASNLNQAMGFPAAETVGGIRERLDAEIKNGTFRAGLTKKEHLDVKIREAVVEGDRTDLLVMGRPEGPGCYCAVNNMLRSIMDQMKDRYDYVVVDCEAGMEHISRQTTAAVDDLIIISDPTVRSLSAAVGIRTLFSELRSRKGAMQMVLNRVSQEVPEEMLQHIADSGFGVPVQIAFDPGLYALEVKGRPVTDLPEDSSLRKGVQELLSVLLA